MTSDHKRWGVQSSSKTSKNKVFWPAAGGKFWGFGVLGFKGRAHSLPAASAEPITREIHHQTLSDQPIYFYTLIIQRISSVCTLWADFITIWTMKTPDLNVDFSEIRGFRLKSIPFRKNGCRKSSEGPHTFKILTKDPGFVRFISIPDDPENLSKKY